MRSLRDRGRRGAGLVAALLVAACGTPATSTTLAAGAGTTPSAATTGSPGTGAGTGTAAPATPSPASASSATPGPGAPTGPVPPGLLPAPSGTGMVPAVSVDVDLLVGSSPVAIVLGGADGYVIGASPGGGGTLVTHLGFDPVRVAGHITLSGVPEGAAIASGSLYVATRTGTGPSTLSRLSPATLAVLTSVSLPGAVGAVVARTDGVLVSDGPLVERRDPHSLAVVTARTLPVTAAILANDPRTSLLWAVGLPDGGGTLDVVALSTSTLAVAASNSAIGALAAASVTATLSGAWVGYATGTQGSAAEVGPGGAVVASLGGGQGGSFGTPNSTRYAAAATHLWFAGAAVGCAGLDNGAIQAASAAPAGVGPLQADQHHVLFGVGDSVVVGHPVGPCS